MKKIISIMLALSVALCACAHSHTGDWDANGTDHWKLCECGEKFEIGEHTIDEDNRCTGCGAEVLQWDGGADVSRFNEQGDVITYTAFDAAGNVTLDVRNEYTHDESGNVRSLMRYENGVLTEESVFTDGMPDTYITHFEDGTYQVGLFDENGNVVSLISYDAEDQMTGGIYSEYALDAYENWYEVRSTTVDADGYKYVGEYNEQGDQIAWITYDPDGNMVHNERYEITYTEEGNQDTVKTYSHDVLVEEKIYTMVTFEDGWMNYPSTIIEYHEDGTRTVTEYDENDEVVSEITYDADGNVIG